MIKNAYKKTIKNKTFNKQLKCNIFVAKCTYVMHFDLTLFKVSLRAGYCKVCAMESVTKSDTIADFETILLPLTFQENRLSLIIVFYSLYMGFLA